MFRLNGAFTGKRERAGDSAEAQRILSMRELSARAEERNRFEGSGNDRGRPKAQLSGCCVVMAVAMAKLDKNEPLKIPYVVDKKVYMQERCKAHVFRFCSS